MSTSAEDRERARAVALETWDVLIPRSSRRDPDAFLDWAVPRFAQEIAAAREEGRQRRSAELRRLRAALLCADAIRREGR